MKNKTHQEIYCSECNTNLSDCYLNLFYRALRRKGDTANVKCIECETPLQITRLGGGLGYRVKKQKLTLKRG